MIQKTIKIKLGTLTESKNQILQQSFDWSNEVSRYYIDIFNGSAVINKKKIHAETYSYLREQFPELNSKCLQWVRDKCIAGYRSQKTKTVRVGVMADYQSFSIFFNEQIQIKYFEGILRLWRTDFPLVISKYQIEQLKSSVKFRFVELWKKDKVWYCHLVCDFEEKQKVVSDKQMGIDCGIKNIAVISVGNEFSRFFSGREAIHKKKEFRKHKRQQLGNRLRNYMKDVNHKISRRIVDEAVSQGVSVIQFERLKHIREKKSQGKTLNYMRNGWSFYQLQQFVMYKAALEGIEVQFMKPAYTSQTCSRCGKIGLRVKDEFSCECGHNLHSDLNGSRNISKGTAFRNGLFESSPPMDLSA